MIGWFAAGAGRIALLGFAGLVVTFLLLPLVVMIGISFTTTAYLRFPPVGFTWKWYVEFLNDPSYVSALWTSAGLALISAAAAVALGVPAALVLARTRFSGAHAIRGLFLSPLVLPSIVVGAAILQYASLFGFSRTYFALLIGHVAIVIPYVVRTTLASLAGFQNSLEEAARDLGASGISAFFRITLPIIKPGVIAGALFAVIISWINVEVSIFNTTFDLMTVPVKLFNHVQYLVNPMIAAVSASTIYVAIVLVIALDLMVGIDRISSSN